MKKLVLLGLALTLTACAGRSPAPIPLRSQADGTMTCDALALEQQANQTLLLHLAEEDNEEVAYNLVVTGLTLVALPVALAYDLSNAEEVESDSLIKRNERIDALRVARGCVTEAYAPEGYDSFTRGPLPFTDAYGRQLTLTSNRYTYDAAGNLVPSDRPQFGKAQVPSLY